MLCSRQQRKRRKRDCRIGEWGRLRAIVQWKCVNCPHWWYFCSAFVRRTILRQLSARSLETYLCASICINIVPESHSEPQKYQRGQISPPHSPYIDMPSSLPWENWHGHLSLTYELFAQFPPNKLSIL